MYRVWKAPATCSGMTRVPAGGSAARACERLERAGSDELAAAVVVRGGQVELGETGDDGCLVAADDRAHAGLLGRGGLGHRATADADEAQRVLFA